MLPRPTLLMAGVLVTCLGCNGSDDPPPGEVMKSLFGVDIPANVKVVHYKADILFLDPSFAWELAPIDTTFLKAILANGFQKTVAGETLPCVSGNWPAWWKSKEIEALPESYSEDSSNGRHIWVDRPNNRLFLEFSGR